LAGDLREMRQKYESNEWRLFMAFFQPKLLYALFRNRNVEAQIHAFAQAPKFTRDHVELEQVRALMDKRDFPRAIALAEKELKRNPQNRQMGLLLVAVYLANGRPSDSIALFKEWIQQEQDDVELRLGYAEQLASHNLLQEAFDILEPALELPKHPLASRIRCAQGTYLYRMGEKDRGRAMMLDAIRDSDYDPESVEYSASVLFDNGESEQARDLLLQQESLGKTLHPRAQMLLGFCYYYDSEWEKALETFDRIPGFMNNPVAPRIIGDCAFNLERYNRARNNYQEFLRRQEEAKSDEDREDEEKKDRDLGVIHYRLAFLEWKRGMHERALPHLHQAIRNDFGHPDVFWLMSEVYLERGETDRAKAALRLLLDMYPRHPGILSLYYRLYPGALLRMRPMPPYGARRPFRRFRNRTYKRTTS
ncbi:MAG TPA: tetratricopeptide repeat protein, partial [bacterium]|nr:tetratricopeptide repeat protein [bacterium]